MASVAMQTAVLQSSPTLSSTGTLPLLVSETEPIPEIPSEHHVLIRVLAVALNPTDHKMISHFCAPGNMTGCDFCGIVESTSSRFPVGTRVCGAVFPYSAVQSKQQQRGSGAFAQWVVADSRLILRVPDRFDDLQGAAIGGVGWGTAGLAFYDPNALALPGRPSHPTAQNEPVLVYGGATASGTMATQLLKLSGYAPIAVTSTASAALAMEYGAIGSATYTSPACVESIKSLAADRPIRLALDCITTAESAAACFQALSRTGGRYACLEGLAESWKTRRAVHTREVMGFEGLGVPLNLTGPNAAAYSREANLMLHRVTADWTVEVQKLLDEGLLRPHPVKELQGGLEGVIVGLGMLQRGEVMRQKLVVRVAQ